MREIETMDALTLGKAIREKQVSVREALDTCLSRIEQVEGQLHSFVTLVPEEAYRQADQIQKAVLRGEMTSPLAGVPVALKDNLCTKGIRTTCSSKILYNFVPTYSAEAVERLEQAGAIVLGKTNMDEFAMGSTTETSAFGITRNPWDLTRVPGGSSGGSCAAVASGECYYALGSDTGGSIRQPSSFCGVTGIKPTYGTVSRYGLVAYGSSLDQIGPIGRTVADCAAVLDVISGHDPKDSTSVHRDTDFLTACRPEAKGLRIGIPRDYLGEGLDDDVEAVLFSVADTLKEQGAAVEEFDLSLVEYAIPAYYVIASAEASSNLARFDGVKYGYRTTKGEDLHTMYKRTRSEGFGEEVKRRILLGSFVLSSGYYDAYYLKALRTKALIRQAFDRAFSKYDLILAPAAPTTAPKLGESLQDPIKMYLGDIYTIAVNLCGMPGMTVPAGFDRQGLPVGIQFLADCFREDVIFHAATAYEQARGPLPACPVMEKIKQSDHSRLKEMESDKEMKSGKENPRIGKGGEPL